MVQQSWGFCRWYSMVNCYGSFSDGDFKTQKRTVTLQMSYIFVPVSEPGGETRFLNSSGSGAQRHRPVT